MYEYKRESRSLNMTTSLIEGRKLYVKGANFTKMKLYFIGISISTKPYLGVSLYHYQGLGLHAPFRLVNLFTLFVSRAYRAVKITTELSSVNLRQICNVHVDESTT
jgi:hypothetical protein